MYSGAVEAEIKPSEISPYSYAQWALEMGLKTGLETDD